MTGRAAYALGFAALLLAAAGPARAQEGGALGQDLAGEACKWGTPAANTSPKSLPILCGDSTEAAATVWVVPLPARLPDEPAARRMAMIRAAKSVPGGLGAAAALRCDEGQALTPQGDSLLFACTQQSNGWPRVVLLTGVGATLYQGDGVPAMLPVLQTAVAANSGHPFKADETEAAVRLVEAKFPGEIAHAGGGDAASDKALVELARLDGAGRNFAGAEAAYRRALALETRLFGATSISVGETLAELALQVSNQGRFDEAAGLFRRATPIINATQSVALRARLASYLALDAANRRQFPTALKYAREATQMRRSELNGAAPGTDASAALPQSGASRGELAHSLRIEAAMAMRLGDMPTALAAATEALGIVSEEPGLPLWWRPEAVAMMAEINARDGRVVPAERDFREAVSMEQKLFGDTAPTAFTAMKLGRFYTEQEVYPGAVAAFRLALAILEKDKVARAAIMPDQMVPFITASTALASREAGQRGVLDAEMFEAAQLVNSDVAGGTIARAAARIAADNPKLAELMRDIQDAQLMRDRARIELAAESAKPAEQREAGREDLLAKEALAAGTRTDELLAKLQSSFPDYSHFADPGPAGLAELQQGLGPDEAFLTFLVGAQTSYALLVTPNALTVEHLDLDEGSLNADVAELRSAMVPRLGGTPDFDMKASYELYHKLIGPLEDRLHRVAHLIVAPSGALASLPLALLVTAAPREGALKSYSEAAWLVRQMALSQVPSARAFLSLRAAAEHRAPAPKTFLGIGDPSFDGVAAGTNGAKALNALNTNCREAGPISPDLIRALPPLRETADEVRTVGHLLGGEDTLLLGKDATERNFRSRPLDQYAVLYFATHGLLPGELHCQTEPGLVLSPPATPARSTDEDGLLDASEIAGLKLNADLVVLSACNTAASGGQFGGDALSGLADAFFNAGARTVLASHWEVPSLATVKLMTGLFAALGPQRTRGLAQSLRQAQLALIAQPATAHPFNWAAFAVIGDGAAPSRTADAPPAPNEPARGRT